MSKTRIIGQDTDLYGLRANVTRALANSGAEQQLFDDPTNGRLTVPEGVYTVEALIQLTGMSGSSGNFALDLLGAGTAVIDGWLYHAIGVDASNPALAGSQSGSFTVTQQSVASIVSPTTGTGIGVRVTGTFKVTTAGTIIPSVTLVTAAEPTLAIGSYVIAKRISPSTSLVSIGPAD